MRRNCRRSWPCRRSPDDRLADAIRTCNNDGHVTASTAIFRLLSAYANGAKSSRRLDCNHLSLDVGHAQRRRGFEQ